MNKLLDLCPYTIDHRQERGPREWLSGKLFCAITKYNLESMYGVRNVALVWEQRHTYCQSYSTVLNVKRKISLPFYHQRPRKDVFLLLVSSKTRSVSCDVEGVASCPFPPDAKATSRAAPRREASVFPYRTYHHGLHLGAADRLWKRMAC